MLRLGLLPVLTRECQPIRQLSGREGECPNLYAEGVFYSVLGLCDGFSFGLEEGSGLVQERKTLSLTHRLRLVPLRARRLQLSCEQRLDLGEAVRPRHLREEAQEVERRCGLGLGLERGRLAASSLRAHVTAAFLA